MGTFLPYSSGSLLTCLWHFVSSITASPALKLNWSLISITNVVFVSLLPPWKGSFSIEKGTGVSVGTVLTFRCHEGFQLVGSEKISCILHGSAPQWSNYLPVCEAILKPEDHGFQVAILASVMSCIVILVMSLSFIICYLQERGKQRESRNRNDYWLERRWDAPLKIYHLPQHLESCLSCNSHLHMIRLDGYENRGYQRRACLNDPLPGLYHTESQLYLLHSIPTLTAPSLPSTSISPLQH